MNYIEKSQTFCEYLKEKKIFKLPHHQFFNFACKYFGASKNTVKKRIEHMHRAGFIETDGKNWVLK